MKAISIRQPWAWAIVHAGKDVENRTWRTPFRGRVLIHAAARVVPADYQSAIRTIAAITGRHEPGAGAVRLGGIIGEATVVDCVDGHGSPWFFGPYAFVLADAKPLPFMPCRGRLGFFEVGHDG